MLFFSFICVLSFLIDQSSKLAVSSLMQYGESVSIIDNIFALTFLHNKGVAFGMFNGSPYLKYVLVIAAILLVYLLYDFCKSGRRYYLLCSGLIAGGAIGNIFDRIRLGAVVDFLDFHIWPVFNLADSFISVGSAMLLFHFLLKKES